jgi:hypothetical protein
MGMGGNMMRKIENRKGKIKTDARMSSDRRQKKRLCSPWSKRLGYALDDEVMDMAETLAGDVVGAFVVFFFLVWCGGEVKR